MAEERALGSRAQATARRLTRGRRSGAVGAAVDAARSVYRRIADEDPSALVAEDDPAPDGAGSDAHADDAELARLRAELNAELARLAARQH